MMNNRIKQLTSNTIIFALGSVGSKLISVFLVPIYTHILTPSEYGVADLISTTSSILVPIFGITIHDALLRFSLDHNENKKNVIKCALFIVLCGCLLLCVFIPIFKLFPTLTSWRYYIFFLTIATILENIFGIYAKTENRNKLFAITGIVQTAILTILNIFTLVILDMGIKGYLISIIISKVVYILVLFIKSNTFDSIYTAKIDFSLIKRMLSYSAPLVFNSVSWWILDSSDRYMINYYFSEKEIGLYAAASKLPGILSIASSIFFQAWTISAISEYEEDRKEEFYSTIFDYFILFISIFSSFLIFICKSFMFYYIGKEYYEAWVCIPYLIIGVAFYSISLFFGSIYGAVKKNMEVMKTTCIAAIINIIINMIILKKYGIIAASISTALSYIYIGLSRLFGTRKFYKFKIDFIRFWCVFFLLTIQVILVSLNYNILIVSIVSCVGMISINFNKIVQIAIKIKDLINNIRSNE